jgi:hypothetical protein
MPTKTTGIFIICTGRLRPASELKLAGAKE